MSKNWCNYGRIVYSVPLCITGLIYVVNPQASVESLTSFIPGGLGLIYCAGILWLILGFMIAFNIKTRYASWGIISLISAYQIMVHIPAVYTGDYLAIVWFELLRDVSLMGGAFFILAMEEAREEEYYDEVETDDHSVSVH